MPAVRSDARMARGAAVTVGCNASFDGASRLEALDIGWWPGEGTYHPVAFDDDSCLAPRFEFDPS
jgi:hypothetical protein